MKVAIVHDWLNGMRGGEKVLESLCDLYPEAPIYTLFHAPGSVSAKIESHRIITSFLQKAPFTKKHYRNYLPFFPAAIENFDLQEYDLVISSSHCVAKGAIPSITSTHICYCHTPMRYIWSHYWDYFGDHRAGVVKRQFLPFVVNYLRMWDISSNTRVDEFVANSRFVQFRISKYYGRPSRIIYPPVDVEFYTPNGADREKFFLIVSALVPYKRIEIAIDAFDKSEHQLVIVGTGPEDRRLRKQARGKRVRFLGRVGPEKLRELYRTAHALIQPGIEDFGINVVEALASACPVIAYGDGGATETIVDGETGLLFNHLTADELRQAVDKSLSLRFNNSLMRDTAARFSPTRFKSEISTLVHEKIRSNG